MDGGAGRTWTSVLLPWLLVLLSGEGHGCRLASEFAFADPVGVEFFAAGFVCAFVGVGTEVVALCLEEVGWESSAAVAVEVGESGGEAGDGESELDGGGDDAAPGGLGFFDSGAEEVVEEEVFEGWIFVEGIFDVFEEA